MFINEIRRKLLSFTLLISFAVGLAGCGSTSQDSHRTDSDEVSTAPQQKADDTEEEANSEGEHNLCETYVYCNDKYFYSLSHSDNVLVRDFEGKLIARYKLKDLLGVKGIVFSYASYVNNEEVFVEVSFWEEKNALWRIPLDGEGMPIPGKGEKIYEYSDTDDLGGVYADNDYIIFFDEKNVYREYDRESGTYNTVDGTDAKYIRTNAWLMDYNIVDNQEDGNILLQKDGALYVHQIGSHKVQPLSLDGKINSEDVLNICSADGKIYYVRTSAINNLSEVVLRKQDVWCYDTENGTNEKLVSAGQIQEAVTGRQSDKIAFRFSDIYEKDGNIYMMIKTEGLEDGSKPTMQLLYCSRFSGSITYEKRVNDYLRYLEYDIYEEEKMNEADIYIPYVKEIIDGKCIIDFDYKEYYFDLETGEKGQIKKKMPEYYYSSWVMIPD